MFLTMDDLPGFMGQVQIATGGGATQLAKQATGYVMPGSKPPIQPNPTQQASLLKQQALYAPPPVQYAPPPPPLQYAPPPPPVQIASTTTRPPIATPTVVQPKPNPSIWETLTSAFTGGGTTTRPTPAKPLTAPPGGFKPTMPPVSYARPTPVFVPPPPPPKPFVPDHVTRWVNTPKPATTDYPKSSWETTNEWKARHDHPSSGAGSSYAEDAAAGVQEAAESASRLTAERAAADEAARQAAMDQIESQAAEVRDVLDSFIDAGGEGGWTDGDVVDAGSDTQTRYEQFHEQWSSSPKATPPPAPTRTPTPPGLIDEGRRGVGSGSGSAFSNAWKGIYETFWGSTPAPTPMLPPGQQPTITALAPNDDGMDDARSLRAVLRRNIRATRARAEEGGMSDAWTAELPLAVKLGGTSAAIGGAAGFLLGNNPKRAALFSAIGFGVTGVLIGRLMDNVKATLSTPKG